MTDIKTIRNHVSHEDETVDLDTLTDKKAIEFVPRIDEGMSKLSAELIYSIMRRHSSSPKQALLRSLRFLVKGEAILRKEA